MQKRAAPEKRITQHSMLYWIFRGHRLTQFLLLLIILASLFFRVFPLEMQKRIINEAINLKQERLLFLYCGLYIGAVLLAGISKYLINILQTVLGQKILVEMRTELYQHVLQLPLQFYRKMQPGTVISAMTAELNAIGNFLGGAIAIPLTSILTFLVFLGFMFSLSPLLAVLSLVAYPFELVVIPLLQKRYNRYNKQRIRTTRAMSNVVNEAISGIHEIHSNASYSIEERRLQDYVLQLYSHLKNLLVVKYGIKFANNLFQSIGPFILFLVGGYLAIHGEFTLGALVAFLSAYEKVYDPWKEMLLYYQDYQDAVVRYRQVMELFDRDIDHPRLPLNREPYSLDGSIEMRNTSYVVEGGVRLLDKIDLKVAPNEQIALVGFSGSGKSTLALLIAQLYDHTRGTVLLGKHDINDLSKSEISTNLTMVAQHPFIFSGTIRDNILYGVRAANDDPGGLPTRKELLEAVYSVGLEEDIMRLGFNTVLPVDRARPLRAKLLRMRQIVNGELSRQFGPLIEIYDVNRFLEYSSLRDNLIFGDSLSGRYELNRLPNNAEFRDLLKQAGLEDPLLQLGLAIAASTIELLGALGDDEFFFQGSSMYPEELDLYSRLLEESHGKLPRRKKEADLLLLLALRYVPATHKITTMEKGLRERVLAFREVFLRSVVRFDIDACIEATGELLNNGNLITLPVFETDQDFVAYCPNEYLYSHTPRDNIFFGALRDDLRKHQELLDLGIEAFDREGLLEEILDIGLDFDVGSKGDRLSGGQRQKVALARAFLKPGSILLMDEATASLDNASQARIQGLIDSRFKGNKTIVAVIHRLDMTPNYDRIYVLKAGSIIEQGTYEELMAKKGAFYELAKAK